jgi:hypothetical protein
LSDEEANPPRKGAPVSLYDEDSDDAPRGGRNKGRPDRRKREKSELKKLDEQDGLTDA